MTRLARVSLAHMAIANGEIEEWSTWMRAAGRPETTIGLRTYHVRRAFTEIQLTPADVTTEDLVRWLASKVWKPNTRRSYRMSLRVFFQWAQATGRRQDNPAHLMPSVKVPRGLPRPTPEAIYLEALAGAPKRERLMMLLAGACGLRRGEIARLRREDVHYDLVGPYLRVIGKGGHERPVPLPPNLGLEQELLDCPPGWIFPSPARPGAHLTAEHVGKLVSAQMPDGWSCHNMRHRCATIAHLAGHDIRVIQELLGHSKTETTALYTLVPLASVRAAVRSAAA